VLHSRKGLAVQAVEVEGRSVGTDGVHKRREDFNPVGARMCKRTNVRGGRECVRCSQD